MSGRTAEANRAIAAAWECEAYLVRQGQGTRNWTPKQQADILTKGKAYDESGKAFEGHHMKSVEEYPECQGDPNNIQFLSRAEHLAAHDGYFGNPTNGHYDPATGQTSQLGESIPPMEPVTLQNSIDPEDAEAIAQLNDLEQNAEGEDALLETDVEESLNNLGNEESKGTISQEDEDAEAEAVAQIEGLSDDFSGEAGSEDAGSDNGSSESGGEGMSE